MTGRYQTAALVILALCAAGVTLHSREAAARKDSGEWQAISAKYREVIEEIDAQGAHTIVKELRGAYFRSASGSVLTNWRDAAEGSAGDPDHGVFIDAGTGFEYVLDYKAKTAKRSPASSWGFLTQIRNVRPPQPSIVGEGMVNGVPCFAIRHSLMRKDRTMEPIGLAWIAQDSGFVVKHEKERTMPSGRKVRTVKEKYDIQPGVEPAPGTVGIPKDFAIVENR